VAAHDGRGQRHEHDHSAFDHGEFPSADLNAEHVRLLSLHVVSPHPLLDLRNCRAVPRFPKIGVPRGVSARVGDWRADAPAPRRLFGNRVRNGGEIESWLVGWRVADPDVADEERHGLRRFTKVPCSYSRKAVRSSAWVFMTMGPCQATGSLSGRPATRRKRTGCSSAETATISPEP